MHTHVYVSVCMCVYSQCMCVYSEYMCVYST